MATDFILFSEGAQYLDTHGDGLPSPVYFLLSTNAVKDFTTAATLAGGMAEITGTGYARQSQAAPIPAGGGISFASVVWNTGSATNWPANVKTIVAATTSDNSGKALCAWNLVPCMQPSPLFPTGGSSTGGSGAAGTYYWKITAVNAGGETQGSGELTAYVPANGTITLTWTAVGGATGYNLYRSVTSGAESGPTQKVAGTITSPFTDTIAAVGAGSCPAANTTAGQVNMASTGYALTVTPTITSGS